MSTTFALKEVINVGREFDIPTDFCMCRVKVEFLQPSEDNDVLESCERLFGFHLAHKPCHDDMSRSSTSSLRLGDGCSSADLMLEISLKKMKSGETCLLSFLATDDTMIKEPRASVELKLKLTLESFERASPAALWDMSSEDLLSEALRLKTRGVQLYVNHKPLWAFRLFSKAVKLLIAIDESSSSSTCTSDRTATLLQCYANLAACQLLAANHEYAIINCDKAIALDAHNVKCLYRRAVAAIALQRFERAQADLDAVLKLDPANSAAVRQKDIVRAKLEVQEKALCTALGKMFN